MPAGRPLTHTTAVAARYNGNFTDHLVKSCDQFINPLIIPGVHYSPEVTFKRVYRVVYFDLTAKLLTVEYLSGPPKTLTIEDAAWVREELPATQEMYDARRFFPGRIIGWNGGAGLGAFTDIA